MEVRFYRFHLAKRFVEKINVIGVDNINSYNDINLKKNEININ